jgi:hypothetical protein
MIYFHVKYYKHLTFKKANELKQSIYSYIHIQIYNKLFNTSNN